MKKKTSLLVSAAALAGIATAGSAAVTDPSMLAVYQVGTGGSALTSAATAVYIDEYSFSGQLIQQIPMPTAASGSNNPLTASGTATSEGGLTVSSDGNSLLATGYAAAPGVAGVASTSTTGGGAVLRDVAVINITTGSVDTSTTTTSFSGNNIRSAASPDGNNIYMAGAATGVVLTTDGASGAGTLISSAQTNNRQVEIYNSQLYVGTGSGSTYRIATVGLGLPTTTGQTYTEVSPVASSSAIAGAVAGPYAYVLTTLDGSSTPDVMYVADNSYNASTGSGVVGAVEKFSLINSTWTLEGTVPLNGVTGLTIVPSGTSENIYATTPGGIYDFTDSSGQTGSIAGDSASQLVAAGTNTAFRGIVAVPEPTSLGLIAAGAAALLLRRRRMDSGHTA